MFFSLSLSSLGSGGDVKATTETNDSSTASTSTDPKPTKKERKAQKLAAVGVLKQIVKKPEIVEVQKKEERRIYIFARNENQIIVE